MKASDAINMWTREAREKVKRALDANPDCPAEELLDIAGESFDPPNDWRQRDVDDAHLAFVERYESMVADVLAKYVPNVTLEAVS